MKVTVLGKSPAWQDAGGACSGYLIEEGGIRLLLDCGNGVFGKLRERCDYVDVDAVVISHLHADHCIDLIPFSFALLLSPRQQPVPVGGYEGTDNPARPRLYLPPGGMESLQTIAGVWGDEHLVEEAFQAEEYGADSVIEAGGLRVTFAEVPHFILTHAVQVAGAAGDLTYGADCRPCEELVEAARDTDLMLAEATLPRPERTGVRGHLTSAEAGDHARRAGAKRLVLTHISDELDPGQAVAEAAEAFGGPTEIAAEGSVYEVPG